MALIFRPDTTWYWNWKHQKQLDKESVRSSSVRRYRPLQSIVYQCEWMIDEMNMAEWTKEGKKERMNEWLNE